MTRLSLAVAALLICAAPAAFAEAPDLKTPAPVIYLSDNLDEPDGLGYCIDTLGRGLSDKLQIHSCKPQGGDVQFRYDVEAMRIESVAFPGLCLTLPADGAAIGFGLLDCSEGEDQKVTLDRTTGTLHPASDATLCLGSGEASRQAGPFLSRDLVLTACADVARELKTWTVLE